MQLRAIRALGEGKCIFPSVQLQLTASMVIPARWATWDQHDSAGMTKLAENSLLIRPWREHTDLYRFQVTNSPWRLGVLFPKGS